MRANQILVLISIRVEIVKLVRVNEYTRLRNNKVEKVKSHYRRY